MTLPTDSDLHDAFLSNRRTAFADGGGTFVESGGWQLYDSATGIGGLNQAIRLGDTRAELKTAVEWFSRRNVPYCFVLRDTADREMIAEATGAGSEVAQSQPVMARSLPCPVEGIPRVRMRLVETAGDAAQFLAVRRDPAKVRPPDDTEIPFILRIVGSGKFRYFVAELDGEVVGAVTSSVVGEIAVIANLFVAPAWRRRGFGAAITAGGAASWADATHVALEASSEGALLYASMGFETRYRYVRLVPRG